MVQNWQLDLMVGNEIMLFVRDYTNNKHYSQKGILEKNSQTGDYIICHHNVSQRNNDPLASQVFIGSLAMGGRFIEINIYD